MYEQTNTAQKAASIIEEFLSANPHPSTRQWRELTLSHPEYAAQIAEISLMFDEDELDDEAAYDAELFNATRSLMLNAVCATTGPVNEARTALKECKGPAARRFSERIGLGNRIDLFNQIVSGEVAAPYVLIKRLAAELGVHLAALAKVFELSFQSLPAQSFKADGKPKAHSQPISWKDAINAAGISGSERENLLVLEKELE